ncbi:hypothetical protein LC565_08830 [Fusobacterium animalis]|uniref:hypothetical protein n=1 Tax=Fusobacterium animalis TaxID=76859 RepID=UPI0030CEBECB
MIEFKLNFEDYHRSYRSIMNFPVSIKQDNEDSFDEWDITFYDGAGNPITKKLIIQNEDYPMDFNVFFEKKIIYSYYDINFCNIGYVIGHLIYGIKNNYITYEKVLIALEKLVKEVNEYNKVYFSALSLF